MGYLRQNWLKVFRDVAAIWVLCAVGQLVVIAIWGGVGLAHIVASFVFPVIGFTVSGCLARVDRFEHLFHVALFLWMTGLINVFLRTNDFVSFGKNFGIWFLIVMGAGGALSLIFVRRTKRVEGTSPSVAVVHSVEEDVGG